MAQAVRIPKGTRDFSPLVMARRNYIFDSIRKVFRTYGFEQIETPSMELRETLTGKYGEEGDRLIFNVLNSGDYLLKADKNALEEQSSKKLTASIADKAMRFDLTVPFARYVVQHQNEISFPFRRFQIQPVWRGDRPQKGRYQEFYQCDADIIGSDSLFNEAELVRIFDEVLTNLALPDFTIKINNRKVLSGIAEVIGASDQLITITVAIDKLDKIGLEGVEKELQKKGLSDDTIAQLRPLFELNGSNEAQIEKLRSFLADSEIGLQGLDELQMIFAHTEAVGLRSAKFELDVTLARGLNYYTGAIFEVKAGGVSIGSICGGGRYDDLTGIFGLKNVSGVGISFGADRIYDVMEALDLFPEAVRQGSKCLFANFGAAEASYSFQLVERLRAAGIPVEIYPDTVKMGKQFKYADAKGIPYVVIIGEEEMKSGQLSVKDLKAGNQEKMDFEGLKELLINAQ